MSKFNLAVELKHDKFCNGCGCLMGFVCAKLNRTMEHKPIAFTEWGSIPIELIRPKDCPLQLSHREECSVNDWDLK
jgi:hypothetical protein